MADNGPPKNAKNGSKRQKWRKIGNAENAQKHAAKHAGMGRHVAECIEKSWDIHMMQNMHIKFPAICALLHPSNHPKRKINKASVHHFNLSLVIAQKTTHVICGRQWHNPTAFWAAAEPQHPEFFAESSTYKR